MMFNNRTTTLLFSLFSLVFSATVSANTPSVNTTTNHPTKLELNEAQLVAQKAQMLAAYKRLLKVSEVKVIAKNLEDMENAKPRFIKASIQSEKSTGSYNERLHVTATAYTSHVGQTDSTPNIAAWGDRLKPGMKVIAVSRDLLKVYGLKHKQKVRIKGLEGEYLVLDKMNKRWRKKIDIYMGMNLKKAFRWGRRKVEIHWNS